MSHGIHNGKRNKYFISESIFPQTIDVVKTKCHASDIDLVIGNI
jgi:glycine cleavage system pyridoxal-binding protein P